jgi:hypothetical protein
MGKTLLSSAATVACALVLAFFATDKLCLLHHSYQLQAAKIEKESWLRKQCSMPDFYSNMRYHTSICEEVESTARIGAMWHAVNEVAGSLPFEEILHAVQRASWPFLAVLAVVCLFFPSILIAQMRSRHDRLPVYTHCKGGV